MNDAWMYALIHPFITQLVPLDCHLQGLSGDKADSSPC